MSKRPVSSKLGGSSYTANLNQRQTASAKYDLANNRKEDPYLTKEEEYKRLNAELEKKTANLVYEAEQVLKANEKLLNDTEYLNRIAEIDSTHQVKVPTAPIPIVKLSNLNQTNKFKSNLVDLDDLTRFKANIDKQIEESSMSNREEVEYNNSVLDTFLADNNFDEDKFNMIPRAANEMSNEAQIRFLKAKLKVLQEETERLGGELNKREEENLKLLQRCKELEEDRAKQLRISNSHQTQLEKYKKLNEELQSKLNQGDTQQSTIKKENEQLKRDLKKMQQDQQQLELKQNRSAEEIERLKLELSKQLTNKKDVNEQDKLRVESLSSENKRLQKQKAELIQAFKKQLKLIDILKKQKMHLEAAKLLQFTEQEFLNALEWNASNTGHNNSKINSSRPPASIGAASNSNRSQQAPKGVQQNKQAGVSKPAPSQQPTVVKFDQDLNEEDELDNDENYEIFDEDGVLNDLNSENDEIEELHIDQRD